MVCFIYYLSHICCFTSNPPFAQVLIGQYGQIVPYTCWEEDKKIVSSLSLSLPCVVIKTWCFPLDKEGTQICNNISLKTLCCADFFSPSSNHLLISIYLFHLYSPPPHNPTVYNEKRLQAHRTEQLKPIWGKQICQGYPRAQLQKHGDGCQI